MAPFVFGLACELAATYIDMSTYAIVIMFDSVNMSETTKKGIAVIARNIKRRIVILRCILGPINIVCFSLASYFMKTRQVNANVIVVIIPYVLVMIDVIFSSLLYKEQGGMLAAILERNCESMDPNTQSGVSAKVIDASKLVKDTVKRTIALLLSAIGYILAMVIWAIIKLFDAEGMAYSSTYIMATVCIITLPGLLFSVVLYT